MLKKLALAGLTLLALSEAAVAQTSPGWVYNQTPTAAQWNAAFAGKQDLIRSGAITSSLLASGAAASNLGFTPLNPANNLFEISNAATARTNLGFTGGLVPASLLASGAAASNLGFTPMRPSNNLSEIVSASAARTNLGFDALLPGLSNAVSGSGPGTGSPGLDQGTWTVSRNNTTLWDGTPSLSVRRLAKYGTAATTGVPGTSYPWTTLWVYTETNPDNIGFEWGATAWLNHSANASTGAQGVAVGGTAVKQGWGYNRTITALSGDGTTITMNFSGGVTMPVGHSVWIQNAGPYNGKYKIATAGTGTLTILSAVTGTWPGTGTAMDISISYATGGNFNATDQTGENDPIAPTIGAEIDNQSVAGTTDAGRNRVIIQAQNSGGHTGRGIFMATKGGGTIDRAFDFSGSFQWGADFSSGTFSGPVIMATTNQQICFDANATTGACGRYITYNGGSLVYQVPGGTAFSVSDGGVVSGLNKILGNSGGDLKLTAPASHVLQLGVNGADSVYTLDTGGLYPTNPNARTSGSSTNPWSKTYTGQVIATANAPTISSCGTSPPGASGASNSASGRFTFGTGTPTACTVTFATAYPTNAFCTVTPASAYTGTYYISAQSASAFTVTLGTGTASVVFQYTCAGN